MRHFYVSSLGGLLSLAVLAGGALAWPHGHSGATARRRRARPGASPPRDTTTSRRRGLSGRRPAARHTAAASNTAPGPPPARAARRPLGPSLGRPGARRAAAGLRPAAAWA